VPVNRIAPSDFGQVVISNIEESPTRRGLVDDRNPSLYFIGVEQMLCSPLNHIAVRSHIPRDMGPE
jgi:hypothetical protein